MSGLGAQKRSRMLAKRCALLYHDGVPVYEIARLTGLQQHTIYKRITLGERLLSLESAP